jgi:hypothetical protein
MGGEWFFNTLFSLSDAGALNETYEEYEVETMNFYVNTGSVILPKELLPEKISIINVSIHRKYTKAVLITIYGSLFFNKFCLFTAFKRIDFRGIKNASNKV